MRRRNFLQIHREVKHHESGRELRRLDDKQAHRADSQFWVPETPNPGTMFLHVMVVPPACELRAKWSAP